MSHLFYLFLTLAVSCLVGTAATLEDLQTSFMARYDEANEKRDEQLKKLEGSYLGALERHLSKVTGGGKLEEVIPVRSEIEALKTGADPLPELPKSADRELTSMRGKFVEAEGKVAKDHAEALVDLSSKMDEALQKLETQLTKQGEIEEAMAAKRMRETLANDAKIKEARASQQKPEVAFKLGEWRSLLEEKFEVLEEGRWRIGVYGKMPEGADMLAPMAQALKSLKIREGEALLTHAPAVVTYRLDEAVSAFRGKVVLLSDQGRVAVRLKAGRKLVSEQFLDLGNLTVKIDVAFPPTRNLELEVDPLTDSSWDWVTWIQPAVK